MASFGWKRKIGEKVSKVTSHRFEEDAAEAATDGDDADWLNAAKRKKGILLEDNGEKSKRLRQEGIILAENGRHWEAVRKWDEAIQLTPEDAALYDMKSQALLYLHEIFPAVQAAETAVQRDPHFVEAWQTLGRAQLGLGEITMAIRSFQIGLHLCPANTELREEDLTWARKLLKQKKEHETEEPNNKNDINIGQELIPDYDFESDEVVAACAAISQRQKSMENNKGVVVSASGSVTNVEQKKNEPTHDDPKEFIKAR
ncbi:tetratricopeptide repeat protein 33 [Spea bombifrons]|uniref:tetratricopeptide repeat protein 33 n=1 Tax=Spea bombifrons TaxID=233779 RepID=UPI0023499DEB|nr:tetratricopeptide repeat protein 33 [Spea bombifrons]